MGVIRRTLGVISIWLIALATPAMGAFNAQNVDTFAGTTLDYVTWQSWPLPPAPLVFQQNNGLFVNAHYGPGVEADYTTRAVTVGVGQGVRVTVTRLTFAMSNDANPWLWLTNDDGGATKGTPFDTKWVGIFAEPDDFAANIGGSGQATGGYVSGTQVLPGHQFNMEIDRLGQSNFLCTASDSAGNLLGSRALSGFNFPDKLYVSLGDTRGYSEFNNVTIFNTPEPAGLVLVIAASSLMLFGRRRDGRAAAVVVRG